MNIFLRHRYTAVVIIFFLLTSYGQVCGQVDSLFTQLPEGGYQNLDDVRSHRVTLQISYVLQALTRVTDANTLLLPKKDFGKMKFIMLNNGLFLRQGFYNPTPKLGRLSIAANLMQPDQVRFVRVLKVGRICLTMNNQLLKLEENDDGCDATPANFRRLIHDDADLRTEFRKQKDKETALYHFIDRYNSRHPIFW